MASYLQVPSTCETLRLQDQRVCFHTVWACGYSALHRVQVMWWAWGIWPHHKRGWITAWCFEKTPCKETRAMPPEDVLCQGWTTVNCTLESVGDWDIPSGFVNWEDQLSALVYSKYVINVLWVDRQSKRVRSLSQGEKPRSKILSLNSTWPSRRCCSSSCILESLFKMIVPLLD